MIIYILGEKQKMMNMRKAAVRIQKATSYDGTSAASKKLRISPSNEQLSSPGMRQNGVDSEDKTETETTFFDTICFGNRRRKRRRLQFAGANRDGSNGNGGSQATYRERSLTFRQFTPSAPIAG